MKNKHQSLFEEWKSNDDPSIKSTNQPKINSVFSSGGEKCKYVRILKGILLSEGLGEKNKDESTNLMFMQMKYSIIAEINFDVGEFHMYRCI